MVFRENLCFFGNKKKHGKNKKTTNLISRILFLNYHLSAINITVYLLLPTLSLERAALKTALYVALQHPRFTHC